MKLIPLKSRLVQSGEDLKSLILEALDANDEALESGDILVIASKIVAYCQGRLKVVLNKEEIRALIQEESDVAYGEGNMIMTQKLGILVPNAGVDDSNVPAGQVILWPEKPFESSKSIREQLQAELSLEKFGVIVCDSALRPLRKGTGGIAMGWSGFEGIRDERGKEDLFGEAMEYTEVGIADGLAAGANVLMGEVAESTPFVIVRGYAAEFTEREASQEEYMMSPEVDLFGSILKV